MAFPVEPPEAPVPELAPVPPAACEPPCVADELRDEVQAFFGPDTPLRRAPEFGGRPYEPRPQQAAMASRVAASLGRGEHLFVEAPAGVGKSYAYLIPALCFARLTGRPVVISTHTIALQEQLIRKDLPLLRQLLGTPFTAVLAKGRENYVCRSRLRQLQHGGQEYLPSAELLPEFARLARWAQQTADGSRADLDFNPGRHVWQSVCSDADRCPCNEEGADRACFFLRARRRLFHADLIVTNHALLAADFARRRETDAGQSLLPDYAALIVDEAHTFEEVAATHLGLHVSSQALLGLLNRLYQPRAGRGLLAAAAGEPARETAVAALTQAERFFAQLTAWLDAQRENPVAYEHPGHVPNVLAEPLTRLADAVERLARTPDAGDADYRAELAASVARLRQSRDRLEVFLQMTQPDSVYWFERFGRDQQAVSMNAVPTDVGTLLRDLLFGQDFTVVLTSATMAIDGRLEYFKARLGGESASELILDTPFNFREQVQLYLPYSDMPDPRDEAAYIQACCGHIRHFVSLTRGRAFVLFTNYSMMNTVAELLLDFFAAQQLNLMVQGQNLQRTQMLELFRADGHAVIFGTSSFWMGVDVPGDSLGNVIIVRLPFPVPGHPLVAAIGRRLEAAGRDSFRHYSLPEAILKFRQGFGRLIRSRDDKGIVVVLDPRIVRKGYGEAFLRAIPECERHVF